MKKKNGGFIATSLIYSFFLAFLAIIASYLNNSIANKTILENFNMDATNDLNKGVYSVIVYGKNANIRSGMTVTNLLTESNFTANYATYWYDIDENYVPINMGGLALQRKGTNKSIYQNVYLEQGNKYYISLEYSSASNSRLYAGFEGMSNKISTKQTDFGNWERNSTDYTASTSGSTKFNLGECGSGCGNIVYFRNAMVINLTASFGQGYEPDKVWMDRNVEWFEGTINYKKFDNVEYGTPVEVQFQPYSGYENYAVTCESDQNDPNIEYSFKTDIIEGISYKTFTLPSVKSNIICQVEWRSLDE